MIDLHIHTTASDGGTNPNDLLDELEEAGITTFSLTDHESISGMDMVVSLAEERGMLLIPGIELSTYFQGREIHLLGYCFNTASRSFRSWVREMQIKRNETMIATADNLCKMGFRLDLDPIYDVADKGSSIGKNHIIRGLFKAGYLKSKEDAVEILQRYLAQSGSAYVEFKFNPYQDAVSIICESGGIPVLAHPGLIRDDGVIRRLLDFAPAGLEVYYYYFGSRRMEMIARYEQMARERGLTATGGSDYHGNYSPDVRLGQIMVPPEVVENLVRSRAGV